MSTESTAVAGENNEQSTEAKTEFEAITSQEDFDKAIQARIARERAKIPSDYEELQAKAARLAEIEEANKTESEKTAERLAAAEARAAELEVKATRAEVAAAKGVPAELLSGTSKEELEAAADALIKFRGESPAPRLHIPSEGNSPASGGGDGGLREFTQQLFSTAD